jgi:uncharacterized phage protein (predicted DNA packaging)
MLDMVKLYLRIEPEYTDEDTLLEGFIDEAKEYCLNAVGYEPKEENQLYRRFILLYVANAYEQRSITDNTRSAAFNLSNLIMQLRHCYDTEQ